MDQAFKILLVDDIKENLIALEHMLEAPNRVFLKAASGNEALKLALKHEDIGLILLDVQMPGMDGYEVARILASNTRTKDIAIIFVTAINKEEQHVLKGFNEGAVDYLHKPLNAKVTKAKVIVFERLYLYRRELQTVIAEKVKINEQLERFMYLVAHDLKSPLTGIISIASLIQEDERIKEMDDIQEYMSLLVEATQHSSAMISSILEYSIKTHSQQTLEVVDVQRLVEQIVKLLYLPTHIQINIATLLPTIKTSKLKLQQVFQNLISNAVKYNNKEVGKIEVGVIDKEPGFYTFYVRDNGPGIAAEDHERVFSLFQTASARAKGESSTGIGLNILKMFVEEQGGKIWVESAMDQGSTFYFHWRR